MFKIPTILLPNELLDKAFHGASKITENKKIRNKLIRRKKLILARIDSITGTLDSILNKYVKTFPSFDQVHKFLFELINIAVGMDKLRKSLGAVDWARKQILKLSKTTVKKVNNIRSEDQYSQLEKLRSMFYGRVSSIINQIKDELQFLNSSRDYLKKLPGIRPELATIVVAGYPNVGKSLFVKQISSAKPTVATYPFTTKQLNLGHMIIDTHQVQIIDTPGLLDRSMEKRNKIERHAVMALRYLADLIIFVLDPSEHCGYSIDDQLNLLSEIKKLFPDVTIIEVENKVDVYCSKSERFQISALDNSGLDKLLDEMTRIILKDIESDLNETV
jgi:nucleolar GTP-binding protein